MDSLQPPTKPPRGVKNVKETSGLLMTVIRTLSKSDSNEQRDQVRMKLERDYKESNQVLQELVSVHHDDLTKVMDLFTRLSTLISNARQEVRSSKEKLIACKKLLTGREELKKLWLEKLEYKYTLQYLREIEEIIEVPSQLVNCFQHKDYSRATHLLISSINTSENDLKNVVGLQELRVELQSKKQELYTKLVEEMKEQIYVRSTQEIITLKRQGSARDSANQSNPSPVKRSERKPLSKPSSFKVGNTLEVPGSSKLNKTRNETIDYSDDPEFMINNVIECVILLDNVPVFLEELQQNLQSDLKNLIMRTTQELSSNDSSNLLEFLQIVTEQFKRVLDTHKFILETFKNKQKSYSIYDLQEVWTKMQIVLLQVLSEYLDADNVKKGEQPSTENVNASTAGEQYDINIFFGKKKPQRTIKGSLFKFDNSAQNNGTSSVSKLYEMANNERRLLCKPSPSYITDIYVPLSRFSEEVEQMVNGSSPEQSKLSIFLNDFVGKVYLGKRYDEVVANNIVNDKEGAITPHAKELNGTVQNTSSPLLTDNLIDTFSKLSSTSLHRQGCFNRN